MYEEHLIRKFYYAFSQLDYTTMQACYHPQVVFSDPAFGTLEGDRAEAMWEMLCKSQKKGAMKIELKSLTMKKDRYIAEWMAKYKFNITGRQIENHIRSEIKIKDSLIFEHHDKFKVYEWAKQAYGAVGKAIGWTPWFRRRLQRTTNKMLDKFMGLNKKA